MKIQKKLNVVLVILIIILLSLVSFAGVYHKSKNEMINYLPQYILGTDLKGYRQVTLSVVEDSENDDSGAEIEEEEISMGDETENKVDSETNAVNDVESNDENKEESEENKEEDSTDKSKDYIKSAEIFRKRLKTLKVQDFSVSCDESNGKIIITIPENAQTDIILSDITQPGKFTIKDSESEEELLTNDDVRSVKVGVQDSVYGSQLYMGIYFNTKGTSKFKEITKTYQNAVEENNTEESEEETSNEEESSDENLAEENTEAEENEESADNTATEQNEEENEESEEEKNKQITLNIDDNAMMTTNFSEIIDNGVLSLSLGSSSTGTVTMDELYSGYNLAAIIENEPLPVKYQVDGNTYISSVIEEKDIKALIYVEIGLALIIALVLIIKYRLNGIYSSILSAGFIAVLLIVIRYANVIISIEGIFAVELAYIINSVFNVMLCESLKKKDLTKKEKNREFKNLIKKYSIIIIPELIIAIVCCFTQWIQLLSFGMITFWAIIISWLYNILINKILKY